MYAKLQELQNKKIEINLKGLDLLTIRININMLKEILDMSDNIHERISLSHVISTQQSCLEKTQNEIDDLKKEAFEIEEYIEVNTKYQYIGHGRHQDIMDSFLYSIERVYMEGFHGKDI